MDKYTFESAGELERLALSLLLPKIFQDTDRFKYETAFVPVTRQDPYDAVVLCYDKQDGYRIHSTHLIEAKVRGQHFDELMLEEQKYNSLMKKRSDIGRDRVYVHYVNFTPEMTVMFNLHLLKPEFRKDIKFNRQTVNPDKGKKAKSHAMLPVESGHDLGFLLAPELEKHRQAEAERKRDEENRQLRQMRVTYDIGKILFGD
jgi:hypothetical protein